MKVTEILLVIDALGMIPKWLEMSLEYSEIGGVAENIEADRNLGRVQETSRDFLSI